jgi:hypothetical protein
MDLLLMDIAPEIIDRPHFEKNGEKGGLETDIELDGVDEIRFLPAKPIHHVKEQEDAPQVGRKTPSTGKETREVLSDRDDPDIESVLEEASADVEHPGSIAGFQGDRSIANEQDPHLSLLIR